MCEPLVQILVPVYNGAGHLEECLDSILTQSYGNWEAIVVNNASTDETAQIADRFAARDSRLRVAHRAEFVGQAENYNRAISLANPEAVYIKFVEGDNWLYPDCVKQLVEVAERDPEIGLVNSYHVMGKEVIGDGLEYTETILPGRSVVRKLIEDEVYLFGIPTTVLFRASALRDATPCYRPGLFYDDIDICVRVLRNHKFGFVHQILSFQRMDNEGIFSTFFEFDYVPAYRYFLAHEYGEEFFSPAELVRVRKERKRQYFSRLARARVLGKPASYWAFHREVFAYHGLAMRGLDLLPPMAKELVKLLLNPTALASRRQPKAKLKIALFGIFGVGNFGNEASLAAILHHLRQALPEAELLCVCTDPARVTQDHRVPTTSIAGRQWRHHPKETKLGKLARRICERLGSCEFVRCIHAFRSLKDVDMLIFPGTGMLDDFGSGPLGVPFDLFAWSLAARLRGVKTAFVSVGAGPATHPVGRWFIKQSAKWAGYRSFRDEDSKTFVSSLGISTRNDLVFPDLVFSLPAPLAAAGAEETTVALGVMAYYGWTNEPARGQEIYARYIEQVSGFAGWLLEKGYRVRLVVGEATDRRAVEDISKRVPHPRLSAPQIESFGDLLREVATADLMVATRFHNLVSALILGKPAVSIGYAPKNDELMKQVGLGDYCQHVERLDLDLLKRHFLEIAADPAGISERITERVDAYRNELQAQFATLERRFHLADREPAAEPALTPLDIIARTSL